MSELTQEEIEKLYGGKSVPVGSDRPVERINISSTWISEKTELLKNKFPQEVKSELFYPDDEFYLPYYRADRITGLHYISGRLFEWLKIPVNDCIVDFYDENVIQQGGDAAGFYTKITDNKNQERELIMINKKHQDDVSAVGAILAHEMMHLYLFRLGLKLENTNENELLTDLATIKSGFSLLIINGMHYQTRWWLTIIALVLGRLYWSTNTQAFGYFKPKQYGEQARGDLRERKIEETNVIGYLKPTARTFIGKSVFSSKNGKTTAFVQNLEKKYWRGNIIKGSLVALVVALGIYFQISEPTNNQEPQQLPAIIVTCQKEVSAREKIVENIGVEIKQMKIEIDNYEVMGNLTKYDSLVDPYNAKLGEGKAAYNTYEQKLNECNSLIDKYNNNN